jgi:hypothetical protein
MAEKMNVHTEFTGSSTGFDKTVRDVNGGMGGMLKTAKSFSAGFLSIGIAIEAAKKAMNSTEGSADELEKMMGTLQGTMQGLFRTIVTGEWESLIKNIVNTAKATRDLKVALDELEDVASTNKIRKALFEGDLQAARVGAAGSSNPATKAKFIQEAIDAQRNLTAVEKGEIDKRISIEENYFQTMMGWDDKIADYNIAKIKEIASNYEYFFGDNSVVIEGMNRRLGELQSKPGVLSGDEQTELRRLKTLKHTLEIYEELRDVSDPGRFRSYIDLVAESIASVAKGDQELVRLTQQLTTQSEKAAGAVAKLRDESDKFRGEINPVSKDTISKASGFGGKMEGIQAFTGYDEEYIKSWAEYSKQQIENVDDAAQNLAGTFEGMFRSIIDGSQSFGDAFTSVIKQIAAEILSKAAVFAILKMSGSSSVSGVSLFNYIGGKSSGLPYTPGQNIQGYAEGTNFAPGGMSLVGERGPELVNLPRGSQVIPMNNQMRVEVIGKIRGSDIQLALSRHNMQLISNT